MATIFWFVLFLLFMVLEMVVPGGFYFASLALGALAAMFAAPLGAGPALALFFLATLVMVFTAAPLARRCLRGIPRRPVGFEALVGQTARVIESIDPAAGHGQVQLEPGPVWLAQAEQPVPAGTWVEVLAVSGTYLKVRPLAHPPEGAANV